MLNQMKTNINYCGIYGFFNVINGKWYVGQSVNMPQRKRIHLRLLRSAKHQNERLQSEFIEYGEDNFEYRVLEIVPDNMLDVREKSWVAFYKSNHQEFGYNLTGGGARDKYFSDESRRKMSKAKIGIKRSPRSAEYCRNISKAKEGHKVLRKTRRKISRSKKGITLGSPSEEHRRKLSEGKMGDKNPMYGKVGAKHPFYGKHHSKETCLKISKSKFLAAG